MSSIIQLLLVVLSQIASSAGQSTIANIISALEGILPTLIKEVVDLVPLVKNIIDALRGNGEISQEQLDNLDALEEKYDAEFEAAVAQPDSGGI